MFPTNQQNDSWQIRWQFLSVFSSTRAFNYGRIFIKYCILVPVQHLQVCGAIEILR